ncbi:cytotoxic T-lymphocyte protein [Pimephales promelas]|nr:cytotoxic T-lymphocyte protein [Pimephales promelas]
MLEQRIIAMAILLTLFHPELTESSSDCYLDKGSKIQIKRVDENATALVSCPDLAEDEKHISISLHKGHIELHSTDMRKNTHQSEQRFQVSKQNSSVSYMILRTEANDTGIYSCKIHNDTIRMSVTSQTILLIKDVQHPTELPCPTEQHMPLPLSICYGIIIFYNLFITVVICYFAVSIYVILQPHAYLHLQFFAATLRVSQPYRMEGKEGEVPLHCSFSIKLWPEEMQISVYKGLHGQERICSSFVNLSAPYFTTDGTVNCRGNISSGRVDMIITGLRGEDTDLYRCEIEILFPPPYLRGVGNGTVVYIQETPNCPTASTVSQSQSQRKSSEWEAVKNDVGPLPLLYAILIITSCSFILQTWQITSN